MAERRRSCDWAGDDPLMVDYHDREWGVPVHDDRKLFEFLTLEGAQAGLSWSTNLHRRDGYRAAFHNFEIERIARYGASDLERLLGDTGIIRNRAKVQSTIGNAQAALRAVDEHGSFDAMLWELGGGEPRRNSFRALAEIPPQTDASQAMSKALKRQGFKFVGPTICYALMQAVGMVNDHVVDCFRHDEIAAL